MAKIKTDKASLFIESKGLRFNICTLEQRYDGDEISFRFIPNYQVIDILPEGLFEGIQGLNLDKKKKEYVREGIPTFVSERIPPRNRVDIEHFIAKSGSDFYNPIALLKTIRHYSGDDIFAGDYISPAQLTLTNDGSYSSIKQILSAIALGDRVSIEGNEIDGTTAFRTLYPIYEKEYDAMLSRQKKGAETRKKQGSYKGRKPYVYNEKDLRQLARAYHAKEITIDSVLDITGWSRSTFFRKINKLSQN